MNLFCRVRRLGFCGMLWVALLALSSISIAQPAPSVGYAIALSSPEQHLVEVQIILPAGAALRELQLPVWNALYQVRDFAQYVNWVRAKDRSGKSLPVHELDKSCWQIQGADGGAIVEYQIYVDSPGPFGAQVNAHHAFLNLAQILMYPVDARSAPQNVRFSHIPEGWHIATPLTSSSPLHDEYSAPNYDRLVDAKILIRGNAAPRLETFRSPTSTKPAAISASSSTPTPPTTTRQNSSPHSTRLSLRPRVG